MINGYLRENNKDGQSFSSRFKQTIKLSQSLNSKVRATASDFNSDVSVPEGQTRTLQSPSNRVITYV